MIIFSSLPSVTMAMEQQQQINGVRLFNLLNAIKLLSKKKIRDHVWSQNFDSYVEVILKE